MVSGILVATPSASAATSCKTGYNYKACATIDYLKPSSFIVGYRDSVYNGKSYTISGSCTSNTSVSVTHKVSTSVKAEVKAAIFASFEASFSFDISKSMTSGFSTSASFKVPPKSTVYCTRGVLNRRAYGHSTLSYYSGGAGTIKQTWTTGAPSVRQWRIT